MGTLATAGLIAVLVDYSGPNIDPDQLARNPVTVKLSTGAPVGDVEHAAGKVALGHYRQVLVFYPPVTTTANIPSFALTFQALNGTKHALTFSGLQPERFTTTQHALALTHHVSQNVTTALTQLLVTPNAFLVDYTTTFTPTALTAQQAHAYSQAAWLSDASLRVNGRQIGSLTLGLSGTKLAQTRHGDALTARFQSQFTTRYRDSAQHLRALSDAPKGATIQFTVTLPGEPGGNRQAAGTFSVPVALFLN
jgi:hypothetical protein